MKDFLFMNDEEIRQDPDLRILACGYVVKRIRGTGYSVVRESDCGTHCQDRIISASEVASMRGSRRKTKEKK